MTQKYVYYGRTYLCSATAAVRTTVTQKRCQNYCTATTTKTNIRLTNTKQSQTELIANFTKENHGTDSNTHHKASNSYSAVYR